MWVGVFHVCVCVHSCMSAAATVGALYQAACMVGDRLATCLFWDCAVRCIPALILEMEGGGGLGTAGRRMERREEET